MDVETTLASGLTVRATLSKSFGEWDCGDIEAMNPVTETWHRILNPNIQHDAEEALVEKVETE